MRTVNGFDATVPALGLAWSQCVNTRIILRRDVTRILQTEDYEGDRAADKSADNAAAAAASIQLVTGAGKRSLDSARTEVVVKKKSTRSRRSLSLIFSPWR